jgi:hypothetical protein
MKAKIAIAIIFLFLISCSNSKNEKLIKNCSDVLFFKSLLFIGEPLQNTIKYYRTTRELQNSNYKELSAKYPSYKNTFEECEKKLKNSPISFKLEYENVDKYFNSERNSWIRKYWQEYSKKNLKPDIPKDIMQGIITLKQFEFLK